MNASEQTGDEPRRHMVARRHERIDTILRGRIFATGRDAVDCQIRNISDSGACLKGPALAHAPDRFRLEIPSRGRLMACLVRWRVEDRIGVQFEKMLQAAPALGQKVSPATKVAQLEQENLALRNCVEQLTRRLRDLPIEG
jgi:hypothetical protein